MFVDVSKALAAEGVEESFSLLIPLPELDLMGERVAPKGAAVLTGAFSCRGGRVHLRGHLGFAAVSRCVNCLEPCEKSFDIPVEAEFVPADQAGDPDVFLYEGSRIDPGEMVRQAAQLGLPVRWLCRPDCKGLCPRCGANRNTASCSCRTEESVISPFSALRLSKDEREV